MSTDSIYTQNISNWYISPNIALFSTRRPLCPLTFFPRTLSHARVISCLASPPGCLLHRYLPSLAVLLPAPASAPRARTHPPPPANASTRPPTHRSNLHSEPRLLSTDTIINTALWHAQSRPPASPPVERLPESSSLPRLPASRHPLPEVVSISRARTRIKGMAWLGGDES